MGIIRSYKREFHLIDWRISLLAGVLFCVLTGIVCLLAGGAAAYRQLYGECSLVQPIVWIGCIQGTVLILGIAVGAYCGQCGWSVKGRQEGMCRWLIGFWAMLFWIALFFNGCELLSIVILSCSIIAMVSVLEWFLRESLIAATVLGVGILWMMSIFFLCLRIILWN